MPEKPSNRAIVREWLVLDKRSLGLFRICLGLVLALDVILRGLHFRAHYTSAGVFPLDQYLIQPDLTLRRWSVFYMNDSALFVALLFGLFLIAALSLTVGYRTRLAGWVCWILILGVYRRNPIVNNAGDIYLPLLLMWGNFLPWNQAFAVDSKAELNSDEVGYSSFPGFCYLAQVGILYWFSAVLRVGAEWQVDGSALYYTLHLDPINTPFAPYALFMGTGLMALITKVTLFLELLGPLLLFVPSQYARLSGVLLIMSFHMGILATLAIPMFAIFCLLGPVGLLPALVWENRFGRQLAARLDLLLASVRARLPGKQILALSDASKKVANKYYLLLPYPIMGLTLFYLSWGLYKADVRSPLTSTLRTLSLDQRWGMFSPRPPDFMGWESAQARLASGRVVDLMTGEDYDAGNIKNNRALWNYRWRAFNLSLGMRGESHAQLYLQYLIRRWEETHPDDLVLSAQYLIHPRTVQKKIYVGRGRDRCESGLHQMNRLKTYLSLPSEGLSLFRRGIGLLCLVDAIWRLPTVTFFLSDLGVLPRSQYFRFFQDSYAWSLYLVSGRPEVSAFLLLVTAGLGALHLAGKSRLWSRICLWVLVFSVQNRHPGVLDASDDLLRLMIFWDIFLPEESKDQKDWLTPATVGWQVQLLFVCIFTATSLSGSHLALAAQWGGGASAADLLSLPVIAQVSLALLALSIVVAPIRLLAVLSMFAACLFWAYLLHPLAPLTLAVASLSLLKNPKREMESALWPSRKWIWGLVFFVSTLSLALNLLENGSQRRPFVSVAQATGFLQDWSRVYPLQAESLVELVARAPTDETVIWTVTSESGRRERLLAQRLLQSPEWGAYLSRALAFESGNPASLPSVWMRVEDLRADYGLSGSELRLVSTTPVQVDTRRKLNP